MVTVFKYELNKETRKYSKVVDCMGMFHQWGSDILEGDHDIGTFSSAIVELADGTVINPPAEMLKFEDKYLCGTDDFGTRTVQKQMQMLRAGVQTAAKEPLDVTQMGSDAEEEIHW